ncbi:hypothetical protein AVEN_241623-1 [Araneus ventricosus]|uniref:Uncharacterized protein n=1 Tax=Araneus ventricosus TaxID=182803 RepID=A0A4Y2ST15_ARAVE|nr:hypothetical protein AVEN_241623-1 [Araneus ventricosus]
MSTHSSRSIIFSCDALLGPSTQPGILNRAAKDNGAHPRRGLKQRYRPTPSRSTFSWSSARPSPRVRSPTEKGERFMVKEDSAASVGTDLGRPREEV